MKRGFLALCLALCLSIGLSVTASAAGPRTPGIFVNKTAIALDKPVLVENGTSYLPAWAVIHAIYPASTLSLTDGEWVIKASGFTITLQSGRNYLTANEKWLYVPGGLRYAADGTILVPARILGTALNRDVTWDPARYRVVFSSEGRSSSSGSKAYSAGDVYWLSRIIQAESGNQSLEGKIAVGNVVLNRVEGSEFPNTVWGVIFEKNQFSPVATGDIYCTPSNESIVAAKLCLNGANTIGGALYFFNPRMIKTCWAARNRKYVATIGEHAFYA